MFVPDLYDPDHAPHPIDRGLDSECHRLPTLHFADHHALWNCRTPGTSINVVRAYRMTALDTTAIISRETDRKMN